MTEIVVDSSSIITLSNSCLIRIMKHLTDSKNINFIIPESVYLESVKNPVKIKKYELNAVRVRDAVEEGYLKVRKTTPGVRKSMAEMDKIATDFCKSKGRPIKLIDLGEAEALALLKETGSKTMMIDERTTRMLIENPENITRFLERKHHTQINLNQNAVRKLREFVGEINFIRSVELIAFAYETGDFAKELHSSKQALEAALYGAKFSGCAVSFDEIKNYLRQVRN